MNKQVYVVMAIHSDDSHKALKSFLSEEKAINYIEELNNDNKLNRTMICYLSQRLTSLNEFLNRTSYMNNIITPDDAFDFVQCFNNRTILNLNKMEGKEEDKKLLIQGYLDRKIPRSDDIAYFIEPIELVE